jgi:hypothetical protein
MACVEFADPFPLRVTAKDGSLIFSGETPPRTALRWTLLIPGWELKTGQPSAFRRAEAYRDDVAAYWGQLLAPAMQIEVPEPLLEDLFQATQVHAMIAARNEDAGARIAPWCAAATYGPLDTEAQPVILAMDLLGHHEFARRSLEFFLASYREQGFLAKGYTLMGTGQNLWTLGEHQALTRDAEWLARIAPKLVKACRWIQRQTEKTRRIDAQGEKVPEYGLAPPGVLADWDRYAYYFYANAHFCAGMEAIARALGEIRHPETEAIRRAAAEYRENVLRAFRFQQDRMPVVPLRDGTWVPPCPSSLYCYGLTRDFYGGVSAIGHDVEVGGNHLIPLGLLDPRARQADWIVDYLEDRWFFIDGIFGAYPAAENEKDWFARGGFSKLQPHYTRTADLHALRDDVKPFLRTYFNTFPVLLNRENLTYWEHMNNGGAWNKTHESAWFLEMTRTMLVAERGDQLWLAPFVPRHWLRKGAAVRVRNAPTHFGKVSYSLRRSAAEDAIEAVVEPPTRNVPDRLVLRVRHPEGKPIRKATVDDAPHPGFDPVGETITLQRIARPVRLVIRY